MALTSTVQSSDSSDLLNSVSVVIGLAESLLSQIGVPVSSTSLHRISATQSSTTLVTATSTNQHSVTLSVPTDPMSGIRLNATHLSASAMSKTSLSTSSFVSTLSSPPAPTLAAPAQGTNNPPHDIDKPVGISIGAVMGAAVLIILLVVAWLTFRNRKRSASRMRRFDEKAIDSDQPDAMVKWLIRRVSIEDGSHLPTPTAFRHNASHTRVEQGIQNPSRACKVGHRDAELPFIRSRPDGSQPSQPPLVPLLKADTLSRSAIMSKYDFVDDQFDHNGILPVAEPLLQSRSQEPTPPSRNASRLKTRMIHYPSWHELEGFDFNERHL